MVTIKLNVWNELKEYKLVLLLSLLLFRNSEMNLYKKYSKWSPSTLKMVTIKLNVQNELKEYMPAVVDPFIFGSPTQLMCGWKLSQIVKNDLIHKMTPENRSNMFHNYSEA